MKQLFRLFRIVTAAVGFFMIFGAAGTDQHFTEMGQMPPENVDTLFAWGCVLLIPTVLHCLKTEVRSHKAKARNNK